RSRTQYQHSHQPGSFLVSDRGCAGGVQRPRRALRLRGDDEPCLHRQSREGRLATERRAKLTGQGRPSLSPSRNSQAKTKGRKSGMPHKHKTVKVTLVPAFRVDIDEKLAPLIPLLWSVGIQTAQCCQEERPGLASITFPDLDLALDFLTIAGREYKVDVETW